MEKKKIVENNDLKSEIRHLGVIIEHIDDNLEKIVRERLIEEADADLAI